MKNHRNDNDNNGGCDERATAIRMLNDKLRVERCGGQLFVTHGICCLGQGIVPEIISAVTEFAAFNEGNDPYGEHDYGSLEVLGHSICWKIDYWDRQMKYASPDPSDPSLTIRVLTVMLTSEY